MRPDARAIADAIRWQVSVHDRAFDRLYPEAIRRLSSVHWTPVAIALRAAAWLAPEPGARILDAGAGSGKVCCIGALARGGAWLGVERDPALVEVARSVATMLHVEDRVEFRAGEIFAIDWRAFDGVYLYNPFASGLFGPTPFEQRWAALTDQIAQTEARLADLPGGTRVVTFHGFGGEMPDHYTLAGSEEVGVGRIAFWIKSS